VILKQCFGYSRCYLALSICLAPNLPRFLVRQKYGSFLKMTGECPYVEQKLLTFRREVVIQDTGKQRTDPLLALSPPSPIHLIFKIPPRFLSSLLFFPYGRSLFSRWQLYCCCPILWLKHLALLLPQNISSGAGWPQRGYSHERMRSPTRNGV
jgi:hypothetical protein